MVRAVFTGHLTGSRFDLAWFSLVLSSERLYIFSLHSAINTFILQTRQHRKDIKHTLACRMHDLHAECMSNLFDATNTTVNVELTESHNCTPILLL